MLWFGRMRLRMSLNANHTVWWDCIGRALAKLWCSIPANWSRPTRGILCEFLSLDIYQSASYCSSLEQDHAQVVGWQGWDSSCAHWSLKAKSSEMGWVKVTSSACLTWGLLAPLFYLMVMARVLGGSCGASFWRGRDTRPLQYWFPVHPHCIWPSKM